MKIPYAKIKANGKVVGVLHLLGSGFEEDAPYYFQVTSVDADMMLISICEGAFDSTIPLIDYLGQSGTAFIGRKNVGRDTRRATYLEKLAYMRYFAQCLEKRLEAHLVGRKI